MSRDLFDDFPEIESRGEREHYEAGVEWDDGGLVEDLLNQFSSQVSTSDLSDFAYVIDDEFLNRLHTIENLDGQGLIDKIITCIKERAHSFHHRHIDTILSPVIGELCRLGQDNFVVDYSPLDVWQDIVATKITATEERPLKLQLRFKHAASALNFDVWNCGSHVEYCQLHVTGRARRIGSGAKKSDFFIDGIANWVGDGAENCRFYFHDVMATEYLSETDEVRNERHRFTFLTEHKDYEVTVQNHFFRYGNKLYIPDGDDWMEVSP